VTEPTEQDRQNAATRQAIADKFRREYVLAESLACSLFGPGWSPSGRHSLVTHEESDRARREGGRAHAAMTVVTARKGGQARQFVVEDGKAREVPSWEDAFGAMLTEPDPSRTIEVRGETVHPHRYELHWSGFDPGYEPRTAEQLAAARAKREEKAVEKEAEGSLFADLIRAEGPLPKRGR